MNDLFIKSIKAKRLADRDKEYLDSSFSALHAAMLSGTAPEATSISSATSALYVYSLGSDQQKQEVLDFLAWYQKPEGEISWSSQLTSILSRFFYDLQVNRIGTLLDRISLQKSLTNANDASELVSSLTDEKLRGLYHNKVDELKIDFSVSLLPFDMEVLDPRIVTVKPGKANEMHKHAHETVFIFLKGKGKVIVDQYENAVGPGDFAFIPRWCNHQSVNTGEEDLVFLAVADFGLTGKSFVGNYLKTARMKSV